MMTTKRMLALLFSVLLLLCPVLSACGGEEEEVSTQSEKENSHKEDGKEESSHGTNNESSYVDIVIPEDESSLPGEESEPENSQDSSLPPDVSDEISGDVSGDVSGDTSSEPSGEIYYQDENGMYVLDGVYMPAFPSLQTTFTVCVYGNGIQNTYYSEEIASDVYGSRIENYVKLRNSDLHRDLGVTVQGYRVDDVVATLRMDAVAGTASYDAAMPFLPGAVLLAQDSALHDLNNFSSYIHFDAPWWESEINDIMEIDGHQYFAVGDITFSQKRAAIAVLFNKSITTELGYNLYDLVKGGGWTMDKMFEIAKANVADTDGTPGMSHTDDWGLVGSYNIATYHYLASGQTLLKVEANGTPKISLDSADSLTTMLKVLQTLHAQNSSILNVQKLTGVADVWNVGLDVFDQGRAVFYTTPLVAVGKLRSNANVDFGILPMPKTTAAQKEYYTPVSGQSAYGICIPATAVDPLFSAYMIEAMACYSKNTVTPEYTEGLLRSRNSADWDSRDMLDLIFDTMHYDLGMVVNMGGAGNLLSTMYRDNITAVASKVYATIPPVQEAIDEYLLGYRINY